MPFSTNTNLSTELLQDVLEYLRRLTNRWDNLGERFVRDYKNVVEVDIIRIENELRTRGASLGRQEFYQTDFYRQMFEQRQPCSAA